MQMNHRLVRPNVFLSFEKVCSLAEVRQPPPWDEVHKESTVMKRKVDEDDGAHDLTIKRSRKSKDVVELVSHNDSHKSDSSLDSTEMLEESEHLSLCQRYAVMQQEYKLYFSSSW
eukprot:scaffold145675_cov48-Attheya_sp.AAC.1